MMTIRIWKVSCSDMTLGIPFYSHLMRSGGAVSVVATWHIPSGGYLCVVRGAFGFPTSFQFSRLGFLKTSHFFFLLLHLFTSRYFLISMLFLSFSSFGVSLFFEFEFLSLTL